MMKEFWNEQARKFGENVDAVNFDPLAEEFELHFLERAVGHLPSFFHMLYFGPFT